MSVPVDVLYGSVRELSDAIRSRRVSPVELAEAYLQRLERHGPTLGAVVTITRDRALREMLHGVDRLPVAPDEEPEVFAVQRCARHAPPSVRSPPGNGVERCMAFRTG